MPDRFESCVAFVLEHECVYLHGVPIVERDPNDPGGTTFCGIDQRDHPDVAVAQLDVAGVKEIYRAQEWTKAKCANFKPNWDLAIFDTAVNPGLGFVATALQRAVGGLTIDGTIGAKTIAATNAAPLDALVRFLNLREAYYHSLPDYKHGRPFKVAFLHGWLDRVNDLRHACGLNRHKAEEAIA